MILYYIIITLYVIYFINQIVRKKIFTITNTFIIFYFLRFYLFSPFISSGYIFSNFFYTYYKSEVQIVYNTSALIILFSALITNVSYNQIRILFIDRKNNEKTFLKFFKFLIIYSISYYISSGVTPPILSPLFGENTLTNRLLLTYNKSKEMIIFYGNTILKDYTLNNLSVVFFIKYLKYKKYLPYIFISLFFILYIGRKSSLANYLLFLGLSLYNFNFIKLNGLLKYGLIVIISLFGLFWIYGYANLFQDIGIRALIVESSFSYFQYDLYYDKKDIGINIFNFPFSESLFGLEHFDLKKDTYNQVFPGRVESSGNRNAQGFAPLFLIIAFGKYAGYLIYAIITLFTFILLKTIQKSINKNKNNPYFFSFYFLTISLGMNYFGVNIFSIFDFTIINFKYAIFIAILFLFVKIKFFKHVYIK